MRLSDLIESIEVNPAGKDAETTCEYLSACGIPYEKIKRADGSGADFKMKNLKIARKAFKELMNHRKICKHFDLELAIETEPTIKVYFK